MVIAKNGAKEKIFPVIVRYVCNFAIENKIIFIYYYYEWK